MDCEKCALENRVEKLENEVCNLKEELSETKIRVLTNETKFASALEGLSGLPEALQGLKESNIEMRHELSANTAKVEDLSRRVEVIDEKGKFDIFEYIKEKWVMITIVVVLAMAYAQNNIAFV